MRLYLGWIVEESLNRLRMFDDRCFCDRRSRHNEGDDRSEKQLELLESGQDFWALTVPLGADRAAGR